MGHVATNVGHLAINVRHVAISIGHVAINIGKHVKFMVAVHLLLTGSYLPLMVLSLREA